MESFVLTGGQDYRNLTEVCAYARYLGVCSTVDSSRKRRVSVTSIHVTDIVFNRLHTPRMTAGPTATELCFLAAQHTWVATLLQ